MKVKALLYCTKAKTYLFEDIRQVECIDEQGNSTGQYIPYFNGFELDKENFNRDYLNGTIVAECEVETEEISFQVPSSYGCYEWGEEEKCYAGARTENYDLLKKSCLTEEEIDNYLNGNGYALHISNLKIFDKPLELCEVYKRKVNEFGLFVMTLDGFRFIPLSKAHQNMMWVWHNGERKVLISIRPEWVCKILNGEKKIEVRRKVLKGMCE